MVERKILRDNSWLRYGFLRTVSQQDNHMKNIKLKERLDLPMLHRNLFYNSHLASMDTLSFRIRCLSYLICHEDVLKIRLRG